MGGLSGAPLFAPSTGVLKAMRKRVGTKLTLVGVGGIGSGADAYAKIRAGASLVQLYTALAFHGPEPDRPHQARAARLPGARRIFHRQRSRRRRSALKIRAARVDASQTIGLPKAWAGIRALARPLSAFALGPHPAGPCTIAPGIGGVGTMDLSVWKPVWDQAVAVFAGEPMDVRVAMSLALAFLALMVLEGLRANFLPQHKPAAPKRSPSPAAAIPSVNVAEPPPQSLAMPHSFAPTPHGAAQQTMPRARALVPRNRKRETARPRPHRSMRPTIRRMLEAGK